jgi:F0F1-type ATP synthase assembly protein I
MWQGLGEAWSALATLMSGIFVWGGVGWGIDRLASTRPLFFVIGAVVGNFAAVYLIYMKSVRDGDAKPEGVTRDAA